MPKVTIYTQAYNPGEYLTQCVESVLSQTYTDFEWLLIDHGSTDNTREVIQSYAERDKRIVLRPGLVLWDGAALWNREIPDAPGF